RGEKLRVFKFKPKRGYKRRTGHRQELTRIEVTEIKQLSRKPAAKKAAKAEEADAAASTQEADE
ncbi:MAG TPA: bL21 family ribosomal protein, partial [Solirubrobacteraceae bacterium]